MVYRIVNSFVWNVCKCGATWAANMVIARVEKTFTTKHKFLPALSLLFSFSRPFALSFNLCERYSIDHVIRSCSPSWPIFRFTYSLIYSSTRFRRTISFSIGTHSLSAENANKSKFIYYYYYYRCDFLHLFWIQSLFDKSTRHAKDDQGTHVQCTVYTHTHRNKFYDNWVYWKQ